MSFDLLVFAPRLAPANNEEFEVWYSSLVQQDQPVNYSDPRTSSPALQEFFKDLTRNFPPMSQMKPELHGHSADVGFLTRLIGRLLGRTMKPSIDRDPIESFDDACFTDYTFSDAAIHLSFSWTISEQALRATVDAALKSNVGFYHVSAYKARPIRDGKDLVNFRNQTNCTTAANFSKTDLFKMLQNQGWTVGRDPNDGLRSATLACEGRVLQLSPYVQVTPSGTYVDWGETAAPQKYTKAAKIIHKIVRYFILDSWPKGILCHGNSTRFPGLGMQ